ncbi:o-succinylbenzoate--CoA ligase [Salinithrix halophila]|uniref:2-succinylbenzoate--CoA ligase n=1 Tax=Salinithrix halophila TaxID=1485204 RepID=A0ABV8JAK0_9BACL
MRDGTDIQMPLWLTKRAALTPERTALASGGGNMTWEDLESQAKVTARRLAKLGIGEGDRVALLMQNGPDMAVVIHALPFLGAVFVPINSRLVPSEIRWQLADAGAKLLLYDLPHRETAETAAETEVLSWDRLASLKPAEGPLRSHLHLGELHTIMYTSGTTGRPKGVMLSYGNHWWSATSSVFNLGLDMNDRWLVCTPFFHMSGLSILMRSVLYGITAVIHPSFDPAAANRAIREDGVTIISVVSTMLAQMVEEQGGRGYPDHFRCMLLGGGPVPKPLLERCRDQGIPVFQTYGLTETASQIVTLAPEDSLRKLGSAGKPLFPSELRIMDGEEEASPGQPGEIVVRGPNVTLGYWKRSDVTREVLRDGWFRTGDIGCVDREGFLFVLDRRSDLIISGGENVYPAEVEAALLAHPVVVEAGVTGVADKRWGAVPVGFVRVKPGEVVTEKELVRFCGERLARYKIPRRIHFVRELPKNASNKLVRRRLPELLEEKEEKR